MEEYPDEFEFDSEFTPKPSKEKPFTTSEKLINILLLIGLIGLCFSIIWYIIEFWPKGIEDCCSKNACNKCKITEEQRYFILVALGGALGAFIHAATSFTDFVGNRKLVYSWIPWYLMRPFIGSALAIVFYMVIRGGLVSFENGNSGPNINPFGIMTVACLAGLFSKQAIDKLREIFENIFQLKKEVERSDTLDGNGTTQGKPNSEPSEDSPQG
jgi:hypothetical protein